MASATADPAVAVHRVIDYARDRLETKLNKLTYDEAQYHARMPTPMGEARRARRDKALNMNGLTPEEAVAKTMCIVLKYWRETNNGLIDLSIKTKGKDIAKVAAEQKVPEVKEMVLKKLREDPGFFRDDEEEVAAAPSDQAGREKVEPADAQQWPMETPTRVQRPNRGRQLHQHQPNMQREQAAPVSLSPRKLRYATKDRNGNVVQEAPDLHRQTQAIDQANYRRAQSVAGPRGRTARGRGAGQSASRSPTKANHDHQQKDGEPALTRAERSGTPPNDRHPDDFPVKADPNPVPDAPKSTTFRSDTRDAYRVKLEHPTTPTKGGQRRNPRRGVCKIDRNAADADASATAIVVPSPARPRAAPRPGPASNSPAPPPPKHIETPPLARHVRREVP
ncbi:hypothetical protein PG996_011018 [Apiospora saccharicola]|uniref:Uncharacterized protein n=1 Tax=Apiospora saccharicola TaxID=335842 RepID=A0ABR1UG49_9PEZI